jgi:8-amino-7-oxononanoate synthase
MASQKKILSIPLASGWDSRPIQSHIVVIWAKGEKTLWLFFHLLLSNLSTTPVKYPTVPPGADRVRITFHSSNTEDDVVRLVDSICEWAREMIEIEKSAKGMGSEQIPQAARQWYSAQLM